MAAHFRRDYDAFAQMVLLHFLLLDCLTMMVMIGFYAK